MSNSHLNEPNEDENVVFFSFLANKNSLPWFQVVDAQHREWQQQAENDVFSSEAERAAAVQRQLLKINELQRHKHEMRQALHDINGTLDKLSR